MSVKASKERVKVLHQLVQPTRLTEIVDIGANPMNTPDYRPMMRAGVVRVTGFEPQQKAFDRLSSASDGSTRYLPYAIGDGSEGELKVCRSSGMTSLFEPDASTFAYLARFETDIEVVERVSIQTRRLDELEEVTQVDLLKIDIQGGEVAVFRNAARSLKQAVAVMTEAAFVPLYQDQPLLDAQMAVLREHGFILHKFMFAKALPLRSKLKSPLRRRDTQNQLIDGDVVFIRDLRDPDNYDDEDLKHLALLADGCFGSLDLVVRCLSILIDRGVITEDDTEEYMMQLEAA